MTVQNQRPVFPFTSIVGQEEMCVQNDKQF